MRLVLIVLLAGCGTLGGPGGGDTDLPNSGAGPFKPIEAEPGDRLNAPVALEEAANLDDPCVLVRGDALGAWITVTRAGKARIEHADANQLREGFGPLLVDVEASFDWEHGEVRHASIIDRAAASEPMRMVYEAGGAVGFAVANDGIGHLWQKNPMPILTANGLEEGAKLSSPSLARIEGKDGDRLRVYYLANGVVWAAEAPIADPTQMVRLDGNPRTPERDPVLTGLPFLTGLEKVSARAADTATGRQLVSLYLSGPIPNTAAEAPRGSGYAAAYDGLAFEILPSPILPRLEAGHSPSLASLMYGPKALLFYARRIGPYDAIAIGVSP